MLGKPVLPCKVSALAANEFLVRNPVRPIRICALPLHEILGVIAVRPLDARDVSVWLGLAHPASLRQRSTCAPVEIGFDERLTLRIQIW